jgi:hypothetical protein
LNTTVIAYSIGEVKIVMKKSSKLTNAASNKDKCRTYSAPGPLGTTCGLPFENHRFMEAEG